MPPGLRVSGSPGLRSFATLVSGHSPPWSPAILHPGLRVSGSPGLRAFVTLVSGSPGLRSFATLVSWSPGLRLFAILVSGPSPPWSPGLRSFAILVSGPPVIRHLGLLASGLSAAWSPGHEILPGRLGAMASWSPGCPGFRQAGASGAPAARVFPGAGRSPGLHGALRPCRLGRKKGATL